MNIQKICLFSLIVLGAGCDQEYPELPKSNAEQTLHKPALPEQFEQWKQQQDATQLAAYQRYIAQAIQHPVTLFELTYTAHHMPVQCESLRFSLPPQQYWGNIIDSLKIVERLKAEGIFAHYSIRSTYRNEQSNDCVLGAKNSKHIWNNAVDIQLLNADHQPYSEQEYQQIEQKICQFWQSHGQALKMGLGIYRRHDIHIDTAGYRAWGQDYRANSLPCRLRFDF